jgi:sortase (surface protein transpeptidase)
VPIRTVAGRHRTTAGRSHRLVTAAFGLVLVTGIVSVVIALNPTADVPDRALSPSRPDSPYALVRLPPPPAQAASTPPATSPATPPVATATAPVATASPNRVDSDNHTPTTLSIPAIGVRSPVNPLGLNDDGSLEVPARGPLYDQAAWYTGSPIPGQAGPAVLLGHVDGRGGLPSVFFELAQLSLGDRVTVARADGSVAIFEVYLTKQYGKDEFPTAAVYGNTDGPELRLITCAGSWDTETGHYRDNTVVFARLLTTA